MPRFIDRVGSKFSRLTVLERAPNKVLGGKTRTVWRCRCDCGSLVDVLGESLASGNTQSCGCQVTDCSGVRTHSMSDTKTYNAWAAAKSRCTNPDHPSYKHYGGRGIRMCPEWAADFSAFLRDMGEAPPKLELERIDNDGPYSPGNCRWASRSDQVKNQRRQRRFTWEGRRTSLKALAADLGISCGALRQRVYRGQSAEDAARDLLAKT
jgi:hypothetical protein